MFHKILVIIALVLVAQSTSEITRKQWTKINRLLLHGPILPPNARTCLDNNIYKKYHKWATNYAVKYRVKHPHKCRHVTLQEIQHYAEQGLLIAVQQYNPHTLHTNFSDHAISYIRHTICDGIKIH